MIYQCYFKKEQEKHLFNSDLYLPIGLEPEVNPNISNNCDELSNPELRLGLVEYGAFLNIYKNDVHKKDNDWWIGFTSYKQLEKSPIVFYHKAKFESLLASVGREFCGWGYYVTHSNASHQSEACHPGINSFLNHVLSHFNIKIPDRFYRDKYLLFANYWAMGKDKFIDFMEWSWPIIQYSITQSDHPYTKTQSPIASVDTRKWLGYFMERLFIIWYMLRNYQPANFGPLCGELI